MGVGVFFGLGASVVSILGAVFGSYGENTTDYRDIWIMAGVTLVAGVLFAYAGLLSSFFPRFLFGFCAVTAVGALATAVICLFTDQAKYAAPFAVWAVTCVGAIFIARRIIAPYAARAAVRYMQEMAAAPASVGCPECGRRVVGEEEDCPWCGSDL